MSSEGEIKDNYISYRKEYLELVKEFNALVQLYKLCLTKTGSIYFSELGFKNVKPLIEEANSLAVSSSIEIVVPFKND